MTLNAVDIEFHSPFLMAKIHLPTAYLSGGLECSVLDRRENSLTRPIYIRRSGFWGGWPEYQVGIFPAACFPFEMSSRPLPQVFHSQAYKSAPGAWKKSKIYSSLKPFTPDRVNRMDYRYGFSYHPNHPSPRRGLGDLSGVAEIADVVAPVPPVHETNKLSCASTAGLFGRRMLPINRI